MDDLKYVVMEIQTLGENVAILTYQYNTLREAEAKYHSILAVAAVSDLAKHAAALITNAGTLVKSECYQQEESMEV